MNVEKGGIAISIKPFRDYELRAVFAKQNNNIINHIENLTNDEILANDIEILSENIFQQYNIECVSIEDEDVNKRNIKQAKVNKYVQPFFRTPYDPEVVTVDGLIFQFYFPYHGDQVLFRCRASTFSLSGYPSIDLENEYIKIVIEKSIQEMERDDSQKCVKKESNSIIDSIKSGISFCNDDVEKYNEGLKGFIITQLKEKREKVNAYYNIAKAFEVPVNRTSFAETHISVQRKITPISHKYEKDNYYCITDKDYEDIIDAIKHTASTYERTPASYKGMGEEDLRNTLLATLNAMYQGGVMGEAFRNTGKTDIAIERENRAAFVAECKMWTGKKGIASAIEQLEGYLTWRDCKTALIYFVRRKNFIKVLDSAKEALDQLPNKRKLEEVDKNEFKLTIRSNNDIGQLINVRVMLFNLFHE